MVSVRMRASEKGLGVRGRGRRRRDLEGELGEALGVLAVSIGELGLSVVDLRHRRNLGLTKGTRYGGISGG